MLLSDMLVRVFCEEMGKWCLESSILLVQSSSLPVSKSNFSLYFGLCSFQCFLFIYLKYFIILIHSSLLKHDHMTKLLLMKHSDCGKISVGETTVLFLCCQCWFLEQEMKKVRQRTANKYRLYCKTKFIWITLCLWDLNKMMWPQSVTFNQVTRCESKYKRNK